MKSVLDLIGKNPMVTSNIIIVVIFALKIGHYDRLFLVNNKDLFS